jgi:hypothetical protein
LETPCSRFCVRRSEFDTPRVRFDIRHSRSVDRRTEPGSAGDVHAGRHRLRYTGGALSRPTSGGVIRAVRSSLTRST